MQEERKVITVLAADLTGSTPLGERLDPEEVKLIVGDVVGRFIQIVEAWGGTIKDVAGDGVLALFGAPVAHEDDAERAVRAGLQMAQEAGRYGEEVTRAWGVEGLGVRVGVHTGPVALGTMAFGGEAQRAAFGDTVNTTARLQAAAAPNTVLVGETTKRLIDPLFTWGPAQRPELKGKAETVVAFEATAARAASRKVRGLEGVQTRFVGRQVEMRAAQAVMDAVFDGSGRVLFIIGEPGIGKSRLSLELRELFEHAPPARGRPLWLEGRCVSYGESLPYWPYRDLLREWLGVGDYEPELRVRVALRRQIERLFPGRAPEMYPYLGAMLGLALEPDAAARLAQLSPEALQYRTFEVARALIERLAGDGPVAVMIEDLHWADATSLQLTESLLPLTEASALLLVFTQRLERDHPSWRVKEQAGREFPHRTHELTLEPLGGDADRELLASLVPPGVLPADLADRILSHAEGNPFFLEELVGGLVDSGALMREGDAWRFLHDAPVSIPQTVENVILARIDRLTPHDREVLTAASVLGRRFSLSHLEGVSGGNGTVRDALHELQRLDLLRESRRWPQPEYRFKHALIQEAAYRTLLGDQRARLHRGAAEWLEHHHEEHEEEVFGLLAHHWLAARDEEKAMAYLLRAGDKARQEYALDEAIGHYRALLPLMERRGEAQGMALVLLKLALALHTSLRFAEADRVYQQAFAHWKPPPPWTGAPAATLRIGTSFLPNDPDPKSAIAWPNIQVCMQLFDRLVEAWPERTIVPSLAERWDISDDGLRYLFHLREGLRWSDGVPLTAHDVEFGIKRILNPQSPGSSVAIYFVLENGQDYYLGRNRDADRIGVRALDDRTVEFRLVAPAPYFMSVMNRPDGGPQPRHAIERHGDAWTQPDRQVVSGAFRQRERTADHLVLVRQDRHAGARFGNVGRVEYVRTRVSAAMVPYRQDALDMVAVRYTPRIADLAPQDAVDANLGPPAWSGYLAFDHAHPVTSNLEFRRALAYAIDRDALARVVPPNLIVATGGVVPPVLQGHTPDIVPRFDPERARQHLARSGIDPEVTVGALEEWGPLVHAVIDSWRRVLGLRVELRTWTAEAALGIKRLWDLVPIAVTGWLPGYPDPEYFLRLLFQSDSKTNEGGFSHPPFDELIERARQERSDRSRLELFHEADRMAVADRVALIPLVYGRSLAFVKPWVQGWWEFGKSCSSFADLLVEPDVAGTSDPASDPS
jgi:ABC-type oligopeptide transport system substrate-binding subunit/class 3 adenylate cyclase